MLQYEIVWVCLGATLSACALVSCAVPATNFPAVGEPVEGGIAEVPNPTAAMAKKSGSSLDTIQRGHEVYMLKCGECHGYPLPQNLDVSGWRVAVPKMIKHAGLESADEKAVLAYVVVVKMQCGK
ncbi:MAG: hypothetical protein WCL19_06880 [Verrucomicrobiota bacterium]